MMLPSRSYPAHQQEQMRPAIVCIHSFVIVCGHVSALAPAHTHQGYWYINTVSALCEGANSSRACLTAPC